MKEEIISAVFQLLKEIRSYTLLGAKEVINMQECASIVCISKEHLYKLVRDRRIPHYKSQGGKLTYFKKSEVEAWMLQNRVKTVAETETDAATYMLNNHKNKSRKQ
jgi:excisionase family DNA binding protein